MEVPSRKTERNHPSRSEPFDLSANLHVLYRSSRESRHLLRSLRDILDSHEFITHFSVERVSKDFKQLHFYRSDASSVQMYFSVKQGMLALLTLAAGSDSRTRFASFGWNRRGLFFFQASHDAPATPAPLRLMQLQRESLPVGSLPSSSFPRFVDVHEKDDLGPPSSSSCYYPVDVHEEGDLPEPTKDFEDFDSDSLEQFDTESDTPASESDSEYEGPKEKAPRKRRWLGTVLDAGGIPDDVLFRHLADQHAGSTACDDSAFCAPRKVPCKRYGAFRLSLMSPHPVREFCVRDPENKKVRGASVSLLSVFVQRLLAQWLSHGCTLPDRAIHLQLGADAKSELPIREGRGKVWSLWLRFANLIGPIPLQSPRRAVIVCVLLGSDTYPRIKAAIDSTDIVSELRTMRDNGLRNGDVMVPVTFTAVGDLPAVSALVGIQTLGPPFPSAPRYFGGFFERALCATCLRPAAAIYSHPDAPSPHRTDLDTVLKSMFPVPPHRIVYGHLHGVHHLATAVVADCGLFAMRFIGRESPLVQEIDQLFVRSRTLGGAAAMWNPFRFRATAEGDKSKRPVRGVDPGTTHVWVNNGGLSKLAAVAEAAGLPHWEVRECRGEEFF